MSAEKWSTRRLQQFAVGISAFSVAYNITEGVVSVFYGHESGSFSLFFFGIQSFIEVVSAGLVLWRFMTIALPGDEKALKLSASELYKERIATVSIGILFALLTIGTIATACYNLTRKVHPDGSNDTLIVSSSSLGVMILVWAPKPWLATALNSSAMRGEAKCSLSCIYLTAALFIGSIIYKFWPNGWWVDSAIALILTIFFFKESVEMLIWGTSKSFSGGCCNECGGDRSCGDKPCETDCGMKSCETECGMKSCDSECGMKSCETDCGMKSCETECGMKSCDSECGKKSCETECGMKSCVTECGMKSCETECGMKSCVTECGMKRSAQISSMQ